MKEAIKNLLINSKAEDKIKNSLLTNHFTFSEPFTLSNEDFLDIYETRLEISESEPNGKGVGNIIYGLRDLLETFKNSKAKNITIFRIYLDEESESIIVFTNSSFNILYGFIV